ncbi:MAG: hypothetical protein KDD63_05460 [Bacteroidetes bacterium]|nr:hypothetical protein [Bacteroidota bacterium]
MLDFFKKLFNSIFGNKKPSTSSNPNQSEENKQETSHPDVSKPENTQTSSEPEIVEPPKPKVEEKPMQSEEPVVEVTPPDPDSSTETSQTTPTSDTPKAAIISPETEADLDLTPNPKRLIISIKRFDSGPEDTLGKLYMNGKFTCYTLEDSSPAPAGEYEIVLETHTGRHATYLFRFRGIHKGMLKFKDVPNFDSVMIHIGNRASDAKGSVLPGLQIAQVDHENAREVWFSDQAYLVLYKKVVEAMDAGKKVVAVVE